MRRRKPKRLIKAELRAMGATPGRMTHRIGPDDRARLEQFAPEGPKRRKDFIRRHTSPDEVTV